jgi:EAL domain-containing protein (putative c-di-GMP-specific phosphodiesterase class I)
MPDTPPPSGADVRTVITPASDHRPASRSTWHDATERRRVTRLLRHALDAGDLLLHYQPLVAFASGRIRGAEALVRLRHQRLGLLPASHFMRGVDQADIMVEFGFWLLDQACAQAAAWPDSASIAVALAPRQLQERDFAHQLLKRLGRTGIAPKRLELGLSKAMLTGAATHTAANLKALQGFGVRLALTIGSADAANPALRRLQLATLRLDRSVTLDDDAAGNAIARAIAAGHELGCTMRAYGVDTKRQFNRLLKLRCDEGQGNYFSPPLAPAQLAAQFTPG